MRVDELAEAEALGALLIEEMESKKENFYDHSPRSEATPAVDETEIQQTTQSYSVTGSGAKRQRVVTPGSANKVIDVESEPRSTPSSRKISRGTMQEGNGEGEKKVLGEIENLR